MGARPNCTRKSHRPNCTRKSHRPNCTRKSHREPFVRALARRYATPSPYGRGFDLWPARTAEPASVAAAFSCSSSALE